MTTAITIPKSIENLTVGGLREKLAELGLPPTNSRNKPYLQRLLARKMAERPARPARTPRPATPPRPAPEARAAVARFVAGQHSVADARTVGAMSANEFAASVRPAAPAAPEAVVAPPPVAPAPPAAARPERAPSSSRRPTPNPRPARPARAPRGATLAKPSDPRLPAAGTVLEREHGGRTHKVTVLEDGLFSYARQTYKSLSTIAKVITGTEWNGWLFFRLQPYAKRKQEAA
jgi:hypothetical protein